MKRSITILMFILLLFNTSLLTAGDEKETNQTTLPFNSQEYRAHLKFLASDLLEGRSPGSRGDQLAAAYIAAQFEALGLKPINAQTGYFQKIIFEGFNTIEDTIAVTFKNKHQSLTVTSTDEIGLASQLSDVENIDTSADLLFVGYGITAPEYKWDDFKDTDIKDKIIVVLVNDPHYKRTGFGSESMTYYGRWTYKIEMARKRKARGILMIHHDREATYGWHIVETAITREQVVFKDNNPNPLTVVGWISHHTINRLLKGSGLNYQALIKKSEKRSFKPFSLKTEASIRFKQKYRVFESANVIGILPGTDPVLKKEAVVYTGHFDHFGIGKPDKSGDKIYNGALDNASGTAALICLARAFCQSRTPVKRTVIFMPVTAEENGLYGSTWYVNNPILPLKDTAVVINKDCMSHYGRRSAFAAFPAEYSTALEEVRKIGQELGLTLTKRTKDTGGGAFRSDHFPFASRGVTALSIGLRGNNLSISKKEEDMIKKKIGNTYHRPNDEIHALWRYDGVVQELQLLYKLGRHWADGATKPRLKMSKQNPYLSTMRWFGLTE